MKGKYLQAYPLQNIYSSYATGRIERKLTLEHSECIGTLEKITAKFADLWPFPVEKWLIAFYWSLPLLANFNCFCHQIALSDCFL